MLPVAPTIRTVCILVCGGGDGLRYDWASACCLNCGGRYPKGKRNKKKRRALSPAVAAVQHRCLCVLQRFEYGDNIYSSRQA